MDHIPLSPSPSRYPLLALGLEGATSQFGVLNPVADRLVVRGAREHNLKDVSLDLPRDALIVFTGLSGSGKSRLAFDTIFAERQSRCAKPLSAYALQFLGQRVIPVA